jgi:predicted KAP-like P-loop ATPase
MFIKESILAIDKENPFQEDKLDREESSEILTQLLRSVTKPFVLSITSGWGTGKTTFVRMWKQHLLNEGFPCIYFNAWENQYSQDPLISFIGEINSQISSNLGEGSQAKTAFENAKQLSGKLAKRAIPAVIKLATYGILDLNDLTEDTIADLMTDIAEDNIKNYEGSKQTIQKFKKNLTKFVDKLSSYKKHKGLSLVFIIDELDRCKPLYVIDLLERINGSPVINGKR